MGQDLLEIQLKPDGLRPPSVRWDRTPTGLTNAGGPRIMASDAAIVIQDHFGRTVHRNGEAGPHRR
jgi:hypothetical protein